MSFTAKWQTVPDTYPAYDRSLSMFIEGTARSYVIDWGDGSTQPVKTTGDLDGDGSPDTAAGHRYADGTYDVSVSQNGRSPFVHHWQAIIAEQATNDLAIRGTGGAEYVKAGAGADEIRGLGGDDILFGGEGDDRVVGGGIAASSSDNDELYGGRGNDVLVGGAGNDLLEGDEGADRLVGGSGADTFVFVRRFDDDGAAFPNDPAQDTVVDFQEGVDKLDFGPLNLNSLHPTKFIGTEQFHAAKNHGELRISFDDGGYMILSGDTNGDGYVDFTVRLVGHHDLVASDFIFS